MAKSYRLKLLPQGQIFLNASDDCRIVAGLLEEIGYSEEHCYAMDFNPRFIANLMAAGFLVMSLLLEFLPGQQTEKYLLLPKYHQIRSCLFFPELHIKRTIRNRLSGYELFFDRDFDPVLENCISKHGDEWLTKPLINAIKEIRRNPDMPVKPVSFALYREGRLVAGEFGIVSGRVYTSYSGYYDEANAGTIQMIKTSQYLENNGFSFWDLGMPLDYKLTLGAREITRKDFTELFLKAQGMV